MYRINCGYKIISAVRTDDSHEIVIGHAINPNRPCQFVVWDCKKGNDFDNGAYVLSYREALRILSNRINKQLDFVPMEAPKCDPDKEMAWMLVPLFARQMKKQLDVTEPGVAVQTAVQTVAEDLLCDFKFDYDLLKQWLYEHGWTQDDIDYFGISMMFDDNEEE